MSIPMILASKSQPRRDVLYAAGICPTIRVSHVDEPAALEREAAALGVFGALIGGLVLRFLVSLAGLAAGFVGAVLGALALIWLWEKYVSGRR